LNNEVALNQEIRNKLPPDAMLFCNPDFDNSIIGVTFDGRAIYDFKKMINEYMQDHDANEDEAVDWLDYNTLRTVPYMGVNAPVIIYTESEVTE
jgi:hypothetical protein